MIIIIKEFMLIPACNLAIVGLSSIINVRLFFSPHPLNAGLNCYKQRIDEITDIVQTLCDEATFRGYESLHRDYIGREEKDCGTGFARKMK